MSDLTTDPKMEVSMSHSACCTWLLRTLATCFSGCTIARKSVAWPSCTAASQHQTTEGVSGRREQNFKHSIKSLKVLRVGMSRTSAPCFQCPPQGHTRDALTLAHFTWSVVATCSCTRRMPSHICRISCRVGTESTFNRASSSYAAT